MKLTKQEKDMIDKINSYYLNEKDVQRYYERLLELGTGEGNMIAKYGDEVAGGSDFKNSKVENSVMRKIMLEEKQKEVNKEMLIVDIAMCCLDIEEYKIVSYMKRGMKMSTIARMLKLKRKRVERIRNAAVKKMIDFRCEY